MSTKILYKLNKQIQDDRLEVDQINQYNLYLQVNHELFRVCVTDSVNNRCMLLEDYRFESVAFTEQLIQQLELIYDAHSILQAGFWKSIKLAVKTTPFSLIPNSLFDKNYLKEYLALNSTLSPAQSSEYLFYNHKSFDGVNIFSADKALIRWFAYKYPAKTIEVVHHTTPLIEGVMGYNHEEDLRRLFIYVEDRHLTLVVRQDKKLEFCNTFYFTTAEDFLYYVMFVFEQLKLSQEETRVILLGEITSDSYILSKLSKYIRNIELGEKPNAVKFGYQFDELQDHSFFDLYSMHLC